MTRALIIGKFMPLHKGHEFLIQSAIGENAETHVVVCTQPGEIWTEIRKPWVELQFERNIRMKNLRVFNLHQTMKQLPDGPEDRDFWLAWKNAIISTTQEDDYDFVYAGEDYGEKLAQIFEAEFRFVDRDMIPISASDIREGRNLRYVSKGPKSVFMNKVRLLGPESVGKTTISRMLSADFDEPYSNEYGREHFTRIGSSLIDTLPSRDPEALGAELRSIAIRQYMQDMNLAEVANRVLFCDTDALTTLIWAEMYGVTGEDLQIIESFTRYQDYKLTFLLSPLRTKIVNDGQRVMTEMLRAEFYHKMIEKLNERGEEYHVIDEPIGERYDAVRRIVEEKLLS